MIRDVIMPGACSREPAENIAILRAELQVPYMSGYTDNAIVRQELHAIGVAFIEKPFTPEKLLRKGDKYWTLNLSGSYRRSPSEVRASDSALPPFAIGAGAFT